MKFQFLTGSNVSAAIIGSIIWNKECHLEHTRPAADEFLAGNLQLGKKLNITENNRR